MLDIELQSAVKCKPEQVQRLRTKSALILSYHDFRATKNLEQTLEKMVKFPADFYKIVSTATTLYDNVTMMKFLEKFGDQHSLVGLCMGEQGIISRVLGVRAGSVFTFAAVSPDEKTAPGQITAQELRNTYRIEQMDAATRIYGVAGDPVAHSLSPAIMNAALRRENVNGVYLALHAKTLKDLLGCVRDIPIHGLSITMPYKEAMLKHLDNTDSHTTKIGACNTVVRAQDGKLYGFNTDAAGVVRPLEQRITLEKAKILVLGAGGAARAAVFGLKERGAEVYILNRTAGPAQKLAHQARARIAKRADLKKLTFDVIINATPVGMGNTQRVSAERERDQRPLRLRHGLRSRRDAADEDGQRARRGSNSRNRDVRPPGRPPVRNLDRQARALGRHAARRHARAERTHRRPPSRKNHISRRHHSPRRGRCPTCPAGQSPAEVLVCRARKPKASCARPAQDEDIWA